MTCWHNQLDSVKVEKMSMTLWLSVSICFNLNSHSVKSNCHLLFQAISKYIPSKLFSYFIFWIIELPCDCKLFNMYHVLEYNIEFIEIIWNGVSYSTFLLDLIDYSYLTNYAKWVCLKKCATYFFYSYTHKIKARLD